MTVQDLLYACGNVDKKMCITVVQATGKELVSRKKRIAFYESSESQEILKMEVDYFKVFTFEIIILV
jgi:hypothetical protein